MSTQREVAERSRRLVGEDAREADRRSHDPDLGRHDLAKPLPIAEAASARYGWPLHVIENAADDPAIEQPEAFLQALRAALETRTGEEAAR